MGLDRQNIERRDFPIGRRGYDPAAVDAHLQALATEIEDLQRAASEGASDSLAVSTGTHVQNIVTAAESAASEIESQARASAQSMCEQAESSAAKTRDDAIAQAQEHVAAVSRASAALLARVEAMDGQVDALVQSLRAGATELGGDLQAVKTNMAELYGAASGRRALVADEPADAAAPGTDESEADFAPGATESPAKLGESTTTAGTATPAASGASATSAAPATSGAPSASSGRATASAGVKPADALTGAGPVPATGSVGVAGTGASETVASDPGSSEASRDRAVSDQAAQRRRISEPTTSAGASRRSAERQPGEGQPAEADDYDARLAALNMALNGDTREATDRYIAENYRVADRQKLLDEVFAAIES